MPAKMTSESHGVLNLRVQPPEDLGNLPVARHRVVMRDAPITPAFVAMNRIVAASTPT